jgi:hypothetical protein
MDRLKEISMKRNMFLIGLLFVSTIAFSNPLIIADKQSAWPVIIEKNEAMPIKTAGRHFADDIALVTGTRPQVWENTNNIVKQVIIAGTLANSGLIKKLVKSGKLKVPEDAKKWEGYFVVMIDKPFPGIEKALVITATHHRGVVYGLFHLSRRFGISPWYWWADVPVVKQEKIEMPDNYSFSDFPRVKYRGIFINDEAPALSNWSREKFGGFKHGFYEKVFELMCRLNANYIWPAMWGNAFYDDDPLNINKAEEYGIVMGTSHHEPLMRAHVEWRRYGKGLWNYDSNAAVLKDFWREGMVRGRNEKIVTLGMRGDGDEPMTRETATALLERIVADQRQIIKDVTGKPPEQTPQLWALYKEVQDYYDKGMRVPDDVTLLLCDDNWGNIRRLPALNEKPRKGGYGIYYHFDYVGGPRNYKWINTNHISRIWEQMHLAWQYNARQIWIVNVGDIKPMEFPISFFLDYAWNPEATGPDDLMKYTEGWAEKQFGATYKKEIAYLYDGYSKINSRRKPELLDANTYTFNYDEWNRVVAEYDALLEKAEAINSKLSPEQKDAYFQIILHPIRASANLYRMYCAVAQNKKLSALGNTLANHYARQVRKYYDEDSLITISYHKMNDGKWNHMMSQTHIGYTYWQEPRTNRIPHTEMVFHYNQRPAIRKPATEEDNSKALVPSGEKGKVFIETNGVASMYATNYSRKNENSNIYWKVLPGHGRTGDAITTFPVTHKALKDEKATPWLEYDVYHNSGDSVSLYFYFSPTLNFLHEVKGFQFEFSLNGASPQVHSINERDYDSRTWEGWVASNTIIKKTDALLSSSGKTRVRYRPLHPGMVLQKIVIDFGGLKPSFLGPPETIFQIKD